MHHYFRLFWVLAGLVVAPCAMAAAPDALHGVWRGEIGSYRIMACFDLTGSYPFGTYYYLSQRKIIALTAPDSGTGWIEANPGGPDNSGPRWENLEAGANDVKGSWRNGAKDFPIVLHRVDVNSDDQSICGSEAFNKPRFTPVKTYESDVDLGKAHFTRITVDAGKQFDATMQSFALPGSGAAVQKVNAALRKPLPADAGASDFRECIMSATGANGNDGYYFFRSEPALILENFLVAKWSAGDYCGGAHPNHGDGYDVFDLSDGSKIALETWFDIKGLEPLLKSRLEKMWATSDADKAGCKAAVLENEYWDYGLGKDGIILLPSLPHALTPCEEEIVHSFEEVQPHLTLLGQKMVKRFREDLAGR